MGIVKYGFDEKIKLYICDMLKIWVGGLEFEI